VHVDLDEVTQLADQELDVNTGPAVDLGWVLASQDGNLHT
jgi:hypothetical protein